MTISLLDFDAEKAVGDLEEFGGASFPIISANDCAILLQSLRGRKFKRRPRVVGAEQVQQDMYALDAFPKNCPMRHFQCAVSQHLARAFGQSMFTDQLELNELCVQRYDLGSAGISPHRDNQRYINLVCVIPLLGCSCFCVCNNREGSNSIALDDRPGRAVLLRAPGFLGVNVRPFHFVDEVQGPRYTIGLRQNITPPVA